MTELSHLFKTEAEANEWLKAYRSAAIFAPPMWPITDIKVERRLTGKADDPDKWRWVVAGNASAWGQQ